MIGIFDSGIGGLSFLHEVRQRLPQYDYLYLGDTARVPYGNRSMETVKKYAEECLQFLMSKGCTLMICACNTMAAEALRYLQGKYTDQKILGVLIPAVEDAIQQTKNKAIGVVATRGTVGSHAYEREIKKRLPEAHVYELSCPLLVPLIEEGMLHKSPITRKLTKNYTRPLKDAHIDTLILGCTHYPLIESVFQDVMGKRVRIINSSRAAAERLPDYLHRHPEIEKNISRKGTVQYFFTEVSDRTQEIGQAFLREPIRELQHAVIEQS